MPTTTSQWYFLRDGQQVGPISSKALREMAAAGDIAPDDLIWKEGMAEWKPARQLKGLFPAVKAAMPPVPPPPPPPLPPSASSEVVEKGDVSENGRLREIGLAQKWVLWGLLVAIVSAVFLIPVSSSPIAYWSVAILMGLFQVYCLVRLTVAMQWPLVTTVLLSLLMLVPYVSTIALFVLNQMATKTLQKAGIPVGFMGARTADLPHAEAQPLSRRTVVGPAIAVAAATCVVTIVGGIAVIWGTPEDGFETQLPVANDFLPLKAEEHPAAKKYFNRGRDLMRQGKLQEAIAAYRKAIKLKPDFSIAYTNLGVALSRQGKLAEAIEAYRRAIQVNPEDAKAYNNLGLACHEKGSFDRAIAEFTEAIRLDPALAKAYYNRGNAYHANGDLDRAIADLTKAIRLAPKLAAAYCNRGLAYANKGSLDRAVVDYTEAIQLDPQLAAAHQNRGAVYLAKGNVDRAIADSTEAILLDPDIANSYYIRGLAYKQRGEVDRAKADFQKARELGLPPELEVPHGVE